MADEQLLQCPPLSVHFDPEMPGPEADTFRQAITQFSERPLLGMLYNYFRVSRRVCIEAVDFWQRLLIPESTFTWGGVPVAFDAPLTDIWGFEETGQLMLSLNRQLTKRKAVLDVAGYKFGFDKIEDIPVVVGGENFIDGQLSAMYSERVGSPVKARVILPSI